MSYMQCWKKEYESIVENRTYNRSLVRFSQLLVDRMEVIVHVANMGSAEVNS